MRLLRVGLTLMVTLSALAGGLNPAPASAGDIVLPVHSGGTVNSWFDHDGIFNCQFNCSPSDNMIRYDGSSWPNSQSGEGFCQLTLNCYDGHDGIDFVAYYEPVYAVSDGTVTIADNQQIPGWELQIWHPLLGYSSYYATILIHLDDHLQRS
jgi:murein DD-endopeptidase MepM/ murein hydrolase activator NlpD